MKLIARVRELELGRAEAERKVEPVAIVWTESEQLPDTVELRAGEHLAEDVVELEAATEQRPALWRTQERVTRKAGDFGVVRNAAGEVIGRVVARSGSLVRVVYTDARERSGVPAA